MTILVRLKCTTVCRSDNIYTYVTMLVCLTRSICIGQYYNVTLWCFTPVLQQRWAVNRGEHFASEWSTKFSGVLNFIWTLLLSPVPTFSVGWINRTVSMLSSVPRAWTKDAHSLPQGNSRTNNDVTRNQTCQICDRGNTHTHIGVSSVYRERTLCFLWKLCHSFVCVCSGFAYLWFFF